MSIGHVLRARREEMGLTQDELAERTGISKPYLSHIETGRAPHPPSEEKINRLEEALEFAPGQLLRLARLERTPTEVREEMERLRAENRRFKSVLLGKDLDALYKSGKLAALVGELGEKSESKKPANGPALEVGTWVPVINRVAAGYPVWTGDMDYPPGVADDYVRCPDLHDANAFGTRVVGDSMEPKFREGDVVIFSPGAEIRDGDDCFVRMADTHETNFKRVFTEPDGRIRLQPRNEKYAPQTFAREQIDGLYRAVYRMEPLD